ncbi:glycosyltransferase [Microbacterium testaceum]|uniref:glycosyltransferase n=1 Tax=Microbacterium testaceum TaxID=2033 RepID=UPI00315DED55
MVRVVVPTLGRRPDWLSLSLSAAANQGQDVEVLVVGPDSPHIRRAADESGARFLKEEGKSLSAAINQGANADGPYAFFAWIADDDVLAPNSMAASRERLQYTSASFSFGRVRYIDADGESKWLLRTGLWAVNYARYGINFIPQPGALIRRSAWEAVGGLREDLANAMDHDLFLRLADISAPTYIPREVAAFRVHPGSISVLKSSQSESDAIRSRYAGGGVVNRIVPLTDRFLLSALRRVPGTAAPLVNGTPYTKASTT